MRQTGFTLTELMLAIAVLSISVAIAVPSFSYVIDNNTLVSKTNVVLGAFNMARIEATKRGTRINISTIDNTEAGNTWGNGYGIWRDANGDGNYDPGEEIREFDAMPSSLTLTGANDSFSYQATGFSAVAGTLTLCSENSAVGGRQISISISGRVQSSDIACP